MVTITTHETGGMGFEMYLDGNLVGQTVANGTYIGLGWRLS